MAVLLNALKKTRKNIRRVFSGSDTVDDANDLHQLLSKDTLKWLLTVYSSVVSAGTYYVNEEDCTASELMRDLCKDLQKSMTDAYFPMSEAAEELLQILSTPNIQAVGTCITEIASGNFFTPSLPS
ncbi:unnamed protein product, partial [Hymenolepis diminuta]